MKATAKQGRRYRARIVIGWPKRLAASAADVLAKLVEAGFSNVNVESKGGGEYVAEASWLKPDETADLPDEIRSVDDIGAA